MIVEKPAGRHYVINKKKTKMINNKEEIVGHYWNCGNKGVTTILCKYTMQSKSMDYLIAKYSDINHHKEDEAVFSIVKGEDFWTVGNQQHSINCSEHPGKERLVNLIHKCKKLAIMPKYNFVDANKILELARGPVTEDMLQLIIDGCPSDFNLCKLINREKSGVKARAPLKDGSTLSTFEFLSDRLPDGVPVGFFRTVVTSITDGVTRYHYIFFSRYQMKILPKVRDLNIDGTFAIVSLPHAQLLTIHGHIPSPIENQQGNLPLCYILMQGKSHNDYTACFKKVIQLVGGEMQVKRILVDYEKALWTSIKAAFGEDVNVRGCWFHFNQCIFRKLIDLKMKNAYNQNVDTNTMVRKLMTLPLMDAENIPKLFKKIKKSYFPDGNVGVTPGEVAKEKLFEYFENQWINGNGNKGFKPEDYTCYKRAIRTNNHVENWNGQIFKEGGGKKQQIYQMAILLGQDAVNAEADQVLYRKTRYVKQAQREKDAKIKAIYRQYCTQKKPWNAFEQLRDATSKWVRWTPVTPADNSAEDEH